MLSLTELLVLGGGRPAELDAWGMAAVATRLRVPAPAAPRAAGRR